MSIKNNEKGFTLLESVIAIVIIVVVTGLSIPSYLQWRQVASYKGAARGIASILREARTMAISTNLQHRVEFDIDNAGGLDNAIQEYSLTQGDLSSGSTIWNITIKNWVALPTGVSILQGAGANCDNNGDVNIRLNPDGTSWPVGTTNICILDGAQILIKYNISINSTTGRVRIIKGDN